VYQLPVVGGQLSVGKLIFLGMALSKTVKRIIISLAFGILFTFGYLFAGVIFVAIFYRDNPRYGFKQWPGYPLWLPETIYCAWFGHFALPTSVSLLVFSANIPLYGALAYVAMWAFGRFRKTKTLPVPSAEPPPPPVFEESSQ
jgi:hypothetical protein